MRNKTISLTEKNFDLLAEEENASKLINTLLNEYFETSEVIIKKTENLSEELAALEFRALELKKEEEANKELELKKLKLEEAIKKIGIPRDVLEWLKLKTTMPTMFEVVGYLKAKGYPANEENRNDIYKLWEVLHKQ
jgi:hypothetical protein